MNRGMQEAAGGCRRLQEEHSVRSPYGIWDWVRDVRKVLFGAESVEVKVKDGHWLNKAMQWAAGGHVWDSTLQPFLVHAGGHWRHRGSYGLAKGIKAQKTWTATTLLKAPCPQTPSCPHPCPTASPPSPPSHRYHQPGQMHGSACSPRRKQGLLATLPFAFSLALLLFISDFCPWPA